MKVRVEWKVDTTVRSETLELLDDELDADLFVWQLSSLTEVDPSGFLGDICVVRGGFRCDSISLPSDAGKLREDDTVRFGFCVDDNNIESLAASLQSMMKGIQSPNVVNAASRRFMQRIDGALATRRRHDDNTLVSKARRIIPIEKIESEAASTINATISLEERRVRALLKWFKSKFFTWVDKPQCIGCAKNDKMRCVGSRGAQTPQERRGLAGIVEIYACDRCGGATKTFFPRFNNPGTLLDSRRGRCGEWANCFCLCAVALNMRVRYVMDFTDHVWAEVNVDGKWRHCDPCENAYDTPLMYESGWGKKLTYVFSIGDNEIIDSTRRYTKKWPETLERRSLVSEAWLRNYLSTLDASMRNSRSLWSPAMREQELGELRSNVSAADTGMRKVGETVGRISGSAAWVESRQEDGGGNDAAQRFKRIFQTLVESGLDPNAAAAETVRRLRGGNR